MSRLPLTYDFVAPPRIVFGWGRRREVGPLARSLGERCLLVCGTQALIAHGTMDEIAAALDAERVRVIGTEIIEHEPEVADVDRAAARLRAQAARGDFVLAVGGGAAIDLGKAAAAMAVNTESPTVADYLEGVGRGLKLVDAPLPLLAMPTTAGTGAEATKNAVISNYAPLYKKSLRDDRMMPRIALVDPELAVTAPRAVTAASGMDAITQLIESYLSRKAQPLARSLAPDALKLALPAIIEAVENPTAREAREGMAHAALVSGMCLANSGLGMAHGVAAALGVHARVPHGAACALMLPTALKVNREVRQAEIARLAALFQGGESPSSPRQAVDWFIAEIELLCRRVGVPQRLSDVGVGREQIPAIVASSRGASMSGNPRELSDHELADILEGLL